VSDPVSARLHRLLDALGGLISYASDTPLAEAMAQPDAADFVFGNPHELALPEYVDALTRAVTPTGPAHFAYTMSDPAATAAVAAGLTERFGLPFASEDILMTNGNFAGLSIAVKVLADPGDEIVFVSPPWFFYETLVLEAGVTPVRVPADRATFDLDLAAIERAISPRTRAIIVNSPNNPSGRIYSPSTLDGLADVLRRGSEEHGRPIYLFSDEAYNRIVFDDATFPTPIAHYEHSLMMYTYAKTLLAPGSRLGYVAMPPNMPERAELRGPLLLGAIATGWAFPVSILQQAVPELERMSYDVKVLQARRDRLVAALRDQGYHLVDPQGTFYILVRAPMDDDRAFCEVLARHKVFVLPGSLFEMPGWFRISVTANDEMVERGIPGFAAAIAEA
jgi:aspartate aminotransferase